MAEPSGTAAPREGAENRYPNADTTRPWVDGIGREHDGVTRHLINTHEWCECQMCNRAGTCAAPGEMSEWAQIIYAHDVAREARATLCGCGCGADHAQDDGGDVAGALAARLYRAPVLTPQAVVTGPMFEAAARALGEYEGDSPAELMRNILTAALNAAPALTPPAQGALTGTCERCGSDAAHHAVSPSGECIRRRAPADAGGAVADRLAWLASMTLHPDDATVMPAAMSHIKRGEWEEQAREAMRLAARALAARAREAEGDLDALELAWGIIANAGGGDWMRETPEWQAAAVRWRDGYMGRISARLAAQARAAEPAGGN